MDGASILPVSYPALDPRVRVFRHGSIVDTFAVLTGRYLVLLDTGLNPEGMEAVMASLTPDRGSRQLLVVNTHGDWDHVWGNRLFLAPEAPYPAPVIGRNPIAARMTAPGTAELLASFRTQHPGVYDRAGWWTPSILFDGEMRIDGGDLTLHLIPTPGHTPDHLTVWIAEIRLLLAGDAAEMPFPVASEDGSLPQLRASLQLMAALQPATALYCHAPGATSPDLIRWNIAYFDEMERRCRTGETDWPLEAALPWGVGLADIDADFYRGFHERNTHAMMAWLREAEVGWTPPSDGQR